MSSSRATNWSDPARRRWSSERRAFPILKGDFDDHAVDACKLVPAVLFTPHVAARSAQALQSDANR